MNPRPHVVNNMLWFLPYVRKTTFLIMMTTKAQNGYTQIG